MPLHFIPSVVWTFVCTGQCRIIYSSHHGLNTYLTSALFHGFSWLLSRDLFLFLSCFLCIFMCTYGTSHSWHLLPQCQFLLITFNGVKTFAFMEHLLPRTISLSLCISWNLILNERFNCYIMFGEYIYLKRSKLIEILFLLCTSRWE